jgi:hypothetical protein
MSLTQIPYFFELITIPSTAWQVVAFTILFQIYAEYIETLFSFKTA